ncbi:MAG: 30S ribosomal protein S20 [Actinomycetota bacterium]
MANIKSQIKRNRQNEARRLRNKAVRSSLKTAAKRVRGVDEADTREQLVRTAARDFDKAAAKGVIHKRAAARRKSRLAREIARTATS